MRFPMDCDRIWYVVIRTHSMWHVTRLFDSSVRIVYDGTMTYGTFRRISGSVISRIHCRVRFPVICYIVSSFHQQVNVGRLLELGSWYSQALFVIGSAGHFVWQADLFINVLLVYLSDLSRMCVEIRWYYLCVVEHMVVWLRALFFILLIATSSRAQHPFYFTGSTDYTYFPPRKYFVRSLYVDSIVQYCIRHVVCVLLLLYSCVVS